MTCAEVVVNPVSTVLISVAVGVASGSPSSSSFVSVLGCPGKRDDVSDGSAVNVEWVDIVVLQSVQVVGW